MKIRSLASRSALVASFVYLAAPASGCADQEQGFYVQGLAAHDDNGNCKTTGDGAPSLLGTNASFLNGGGLYTECFIFRSRLGAPQGVSKVSDNTSAYTILLERVEVDVLRNGTPIESFDVKVSGRIGDDGDGKSAGPGILAAGVPIMSANGAAALSGLGAGEQTLLDVQVRAFGHTAGGLDVETEPYETSLLYVNQ